MTSESAESVLKSCFLFLQTIKHVFQVRKSKIFHKSLISLKNQRNAALHMWDTKDRTESFSCCFCLSFGKTCLLRTSNSLVKRFKANISTCWENKPWSGHFLINVMDRKRGDLLLSSLLWFFFFATWIYDSTYCQVLFPLLFLWKLSLPRHRLYNKHKNAEKQNCKESRVEENTLNIKQCALQAEDFQHILFTFWTSVVALQMILWQTLTLMESQEKQHLKEHIGVIQTFDLLLYDKECKLLFGTKTTWTEAALKENRICVGDLSNSTDRVPHLKWDSWSIFNFLCVQKVNNKDCLHGNLCPLPGILS